jgi:RNA polymerase-binding transcription factor
MSLKQKVTFQREAGFHASAFAKTEGKLRNDCRWAIAKLKAERSIGQDFEALDLRRGGSKARGAPLKKALEQLRISKKTSQTWRKVARIPTEWFDRYLEQHETDAAALSTDAILFAGEAEQPGHLNIAGARDPGVGYPMRKAGLRQMLSERRREMQDDIHSRIRDGRTDRPNDVRDDLEVSDADIQGDIEFALLQMRAETLTRIDEALVRLDAGEYGACVECDGEIAERRLRALPFAVRCQACEERREHAQGHARQLAQQRGSLSFFSDVVSS